ncbi:endoplasmic oxidoreductin-1 [Cryptotrichosporon argae]
MRAIAAALLVAPVIASSLYEPSRPDSKIARNVLEGKSEGYCSPSGPIESTHCAYETVESLNKDLFPALHELVGYPFFRHYKVDLYRECPFWYENGFCMNRACGVEAADESEIPDKWRAQALSEVRVSSPEDNGVSSCYFREQDFCYIEDDTTDEGQYVDLTLNPERFTGYAGDSAHRVWQAIYEENCFGLSEAAVEAHKAGGAGSLEQLAAAVVGAGGVSHASGANADAGAWGFSKLSEGWGTEMVKSRLGGDVDMCEEKKVYYRVISGLHASISIHICADYLDQTTGEWAPNLACFISRLATHPERLSNVYFNAVLLLRAVARAVPYFRAYDIGVGTLPATGAGMDCREAAVGQTDEDARARTSFDKVLALAQVEQVSRGFDEHEFFRGEDALVLKEQFKSHFRNVSRIMDCVGCDKCRLWGKLQVSGIGTALKILFELDETALDPKVNPNLLQRSEVVALFNTLHRVSESLAAVEDFRRIYAETQAAEAVARRERAAHEHARESAEAAERERARRAGAWPSVVAAVVSALEALRRSCRGCLRAGLAQVQRGPLAGLLAELRQWAGLTKTEL